MALLAGTLYDPAVAVSQATSALLAMTAFDTTNLRLNFTVPSNGSVLVRLSTVIHGGTAAPTVLLGVLQGSTVKGRKAPTGMLYTATGVATQAYAIESIFPVTGLTPSANLTWDAAYSVETLGASTAIKYGGPDNATANDAFGGFCFEIWSVG
jgi:hypothetical protein